jgi:hypothetical protein
MFKGIKRLQGARTAKKRLPITTAILDKLEPLHDAHSLQGRCLRAAMWLATCGLLRSGEVAYRTKKSVPLLRSHLSFHTEDNTQITMMSEWSQAGYMKVHVPASKTDPFLEGVDVVVSNDRAIKAMSEYLVMRGTMEDSVPLFVLRHASTTGLTVDQLVSHTQTMLTKAAVVDAHLYKGHSFRKGGATSLHEAGMPDSLIKTMGRWLSFTFATYVHTSQHLLIKAGRAMTRARVLGKRISFDPNMNRTWD